MKNEPKRHHLVQSAFLDAWSDSSGYLNVENLRIKKKLRLKSDNCFFEKLFYKGVLPKEYQNEEQSVVEKEATEIAEKIFENQHIKDGKLNIVIPSVSKKPLDKENFIKHLIEDASPNNLSLEERLSCIESPGLGLISEIRQNPNNFIDKKSNQILADYLSLQWVRGNAMRKNIGNINSQMLKGLDTAKGNKNWTSIPHQDGKERPIRRIDLEPNKERDNFTHLQIIRDFLVNKAMLSKYFIGKRISILHSPPTERFCISDNPIVLDNYEIAKQGNYAVALAFTGTSIYMPISPTQTIKLNAEIEQDFHLGYEHCAGISNVEQLCRLNNAQRRQSYIWIAY